MAEHGAKSGEELEAARIEVRTAGRILAIRSFGKANFLVLSDGTARVQVYLRQDSLPERDFQIFKLLDFGDWVGVSGRLFRTRTHEFTIHASSLEFLAKCLLPLPEKWHGLQDVEIRYRQRYLDLIVNPESRRVFEVRSRVVTAIREFLIGRGFLEVETPMMQPIAGGALARPFVTHHNALDMRLYMRIAPELYLKRLTVGGIEKVFEINRNFRNEGISTQHNPEFTMLEFYWSYADYNDLMLADRADVSGSGAEGDRQRSGCVWRPHDLAGVAVPPAVACARPRARRRRGGSGPTSRSRRCARATRRPTLAGRLGIEVDPAAGPGKIAAEIFETLCEDDLVQPTFVYDFPTEVSPLAKQNPNDPDTVERFELYIGGFEVANAFSELNDPARAAAPLRGAAPQPRWRRRGGARDGRGLRAGARVRHAPGGGEGIGIDRLVMLLTNSPSIRDVILFPLMRPR